MFVVSATVFCIYLSEFLYTQIFGVYNHQTIQIVLQAVSSLICEAYGQIREEKILTQDTTTIIRAGGYSM